MPRKEKTVTITRAGRDAGKQFALREMPADQAERWANRAILALAAAGARLPEGALEGAAGLAFTYQNILLTGLRSLQGIRWEEVEPLFGEMVPCIKYQPPNPSMPQQPLLPGDNSQVEEVATWWELRRELVELHLGFSLAVSA